MYFHTGLCFGISGRAEFNNRTHKNNRYHFSVSAWPVAFTVVVVTLPFINCLFFIYATCLRTVDMNYIMQKLHRKINVGIHEPYI